MSLLLHILVRLHGLPPHNCHLLGGARLETHDWRTLLPSVDLLKALLHLFLTTLEVILLLLQTNLVALHSKRERQKLLELCHGKELVLRLLVVTNPVTVLGLLHIEGWALAHLVHG